MTEEEKRELAEKLVVFRALKSFAERLAFWEQELKIPYLDFLVNTDAYKNYKVFRLDSFKEDWMELNKWILKEYTAYYENPENSKKAKTQLIPLLSYRSLKQDLDEKLAIAENEDEAINLINQASKQIHDSVNNSFLFDSTYAVDNFSFHDFFLNRVLPDYSKIRPSIETIRVENGKVLAHYAHYVATLKNKLWKKQDKTLLEDAMTHDQFAIAVRCLDFMDCRKRSDVENAKIFSFLTGRNYHKLRVAFGKALRAKTDDLLRVYKLMLEHDLEKYTYDLKQEINKRVKKR